MIDQFVLQHLQKLTHLTELTLIGFDFVVTHPRLYPVTSVTKLTVVSEFRDNGHLLKNFCTEDNPLDWSVNRLDVQLFRRALFDQFPNLTQLTLIGNVHQHELTRERLAHGFSDSQLDRLDMFFRDKRVVAPRPSGLANAQIGRASCRERV